MWVYIILAVIILFFLCSYIIKVRKRRIIRRLLIKSLSALNKCNIDYFITYGTLLGYYRDNDVIWGDNDGDIVVPVNESEKILSIDWSCYGLQLKTLDECKKSIIDYKKQFEPSKKRTMFRLFDKDCSVTILDYYIDLYIMDVEDGKCNIRTEGDYCYKLNIEDIYPTNTVSFLNTPCKVPKNIPKILGEFYGDYMTPKSRNFTRITCDKNKWKNKYCDKLI